MSNKSNNPIEINIVFYVLFAMSFFITILVSFLSYRIGIMAEKISVLETQNPLPQEINK